MTHDELLDYLREHEEYWTSLRAQRWAKVPAFNALRAVVELHKPIEEDGKLWCRHEVCYNHIEFLERNDCYCSYPCPTIKDIEKELS